MRPNGGPNRPKYPMEYETNPDILLNMTAQQWDDLLTRLEGARLGPRKLIRLKRSRAPFGHGMAVEDLREGVLEDLAKGVKGVDVAKKFNVSVSYVSRIKNGTR